MERSDMLHKSEWGLVRIIVPAYPRESIFTKVVTKITALGPIKLAAMISMIWGWRVEVIDENNYTGPRGNNDGLPDHQALQAEKPAQVVAIYGAMTCTIERLWNIAELYKTAGAMVIAGGWHAKDNPKETMEHHVDAVFYGKEGLAISGSIREFFGNLEAGKSWTATQGIYYLEGGTVKSNPLSESEAVRGYDRSLDNQPFADFSLLRYAHKIEVYTVRRVVGCSGGCEFCRVCEPPRWASPERFFDEVKSLVERFGARMFFRTDDNSGEDRAGELVFWRMIEAKYGKKLRFGVQVRADIANDSELIDAMIAGGVRDLYIGVESPIDEELAAMKKGYCSKDMEQWIRALRKKFRHVHEMFVVNYPLQEAKNNLSADQIVGRFKRFIRKTRPDSIQVTSAGPLPKTGLRARMQKEDRLLPFEVAPWNKYDGTFALILPDNMSFEECQEIPLRLMSWFYSPLSWFRIVLRICLPPLFYNPIKGWRGWKRALRTDAIKQFGSGIMRKWRQRKEKERLIQRVKDYLARK